MDMSGILEEATPDDSEDRNDNLSSFTMSDLYDDTGAKHMALEVTTNTNVM
jgi:hypothetical protein